jgi:hypothetical protein
MFASDDTCAYLHIKFAAPSVVCFDCQYYNEALRYAYVIYVSHALKL